MRGTPQRCRRLSLFWFEVTLMTPAFRLERQHPWSGWRLSNACSLPLGLSRPLLHRYHRHHPPPLLKLYAPVPGACGSCDPSGSACTAGPLARVSWHLLSSAWCTHTRCDYDRESHCMQATRCECTVILAASHAYCDERSHVAAGTRLRALSTSALQDSATDVLYTRGVMQV